MDLRASNKVLTMFEFEIIGPLDQKSKFAHFDFLHFLKNWPSSTAHNLINLYHMNAILDFLESSRCPVHPSC